MHAHTGSTTLALFLFAGVALAMLMAIAIVVNACIRLWRETIAATDHEPSRRSSSKQTASIILRSPKSLPSA